MQLELRLYSARAGVGLLYGQVRGDNVGVILVFLLRLVVCVFVVCLSFLWLSQVDEIFRTEIRALQFL